MARVNNHQLPNLSFVGKTLSSIVLLLGLILFISAWFFSVFLTSWGFSIMGLVELGQILQLVREQSARTFYVLWAIHAASLPLVLGVTNRLFKRVALPRGTLFAMMAVPITLGFLDMACWAALPWSPAAQALLGPVQLLENLCLFVLVVLPLREMWVYRRWQNRSGRKQRVVIVGGGFGGLYTAIGLDRVLGYHPDLEIILIDKKNYFLFPPLLPSVATGSIESRQVTNPFRRIFEATNVIFKKEFVERIDFPGRSLFTQVSVDQDPDNQAVIRKESKLEFDYLVLAPGSETNTFNTEGVEEYAFFMRELGDAISVRNHIIDCFELAARDTSASVQRELLRFVIVGGGPTGVELTAEIHDLIKHVLLKRYPEIDKNFVEVFLVQSGNQVLPGWHHSLVDGTAEQLSHLEVKVLLGTRVTKVGSRSVTLSSGEVVPTRTCVWCSGVKPASILANCNIPRAKNGSIPVEADLRVAGLENVFVLGDAAYCEDKSTGRAFPALAQVALQQGAQTASNLARLLQGRQTQPFRYFNYGSLLCVGEHFAVVELMGVRLRGFLAWFIWRTLYLAKLVGFGNKVRVMLDWTLDLLVERSISQIWTSRQEVQIRPSGTALEPAAVAAASAAGAPSATRPVP